MRIITEPKVYLLGSQVLNQGEVDRFLEDEGITWDTDAASAGEALIEASGRLCYMSYHNPLGRTNAGYIANIIEQQHFSVTEHCHFTFLITGVSRSLTHELIRSRHFSYSQLSQRYVDESDVAFVMPPDILASPEYIQQFWIGSVGGILQQYRKLAELLEIHSNLERPDINKRDRRIEVRQAARSVLPNAAETKIVVSGNARSYRELLEKRGSEWAEPEIRRLALKLYDVLKEQVPAVMQDLYTEEHPQAGLVIRKRS